MNTIGQLAQGKKLEMDHIFETELLPLQDNVYNFALYLCRDKEDAADLVQDTYMKAFQALGSYQKGTNAKAWLFRIAKNTFINDYRKKMRQPKEVDADDVFSILERQGGEVIQSNPQESRILESLGDEVTAAVNALGPVYRLVVLLCDIEEFTYEEMAAILDVPIGTVRSRLHRGRKLLKEKLSSYAQEMGYRDID